MNNPDVVVTYKSLNSSVTLFNNRIEVNKLSSIKSYGYGEIKTVELSGVFNVRLFLVFWNGHKIELVDMSKSDMGACCTLLKKLIRTLRRDEGYGGCIKVGCTYIGGSGVSFLVQGKSYPIVIIDKNDALRIIGSDSQRFDIKFNQLTELKIDGPGRVTTDAGVIGGGFGLEGALIGIGAATLLNAITTSTTTNTMLYLAWPGAEVFFHTAEYTPDKARLAFSHAFTAIKLDKGGRAPDLVSQLERLGALNISGALSDDEYALAKAKLLANTE